MKTLLIAITALAAATTTLAGPPRHHAPHGPAIFHAYYPRHAPLRHLPPPHHYHHPSGWFWAGFGTGLVFEALKPAPPPPPIVVGPVIQQTRVWVPPVYETRPVYDAYGRIIRYEQVLIRAGYWQ